MSIKMAKGDPKFVEACQKASEATNKPVQPTRRQYKKWQRKEGSAYKFGR